jgi:hypothetical protein
MPPAPQTEAACLLQSGALYRSRVGVQNVADDVGLVFAGFKKGAFSLYFDDAPIYHFDLEGRWQRAYIESTHYLKSLDTSVYAIDRVREGANMVLKRRRLDRDDTRNLDEHIRSEAARLHSEMKTGAPRIQNPPEGKARPLSLLEVGEFLLRIAGWDERAWESHRLQYAQTYGRPPFLPPESQNATVFQATVGHPGGWSFGGRPVADDTIRTLAQFEGHAQRVVTLMGSRLLLAPNAFVAGSNLLRQPAELVASFLEIVRRTLSSAIVDTSRTAEVDDGPRFREIHTFLDEFSAPRPAVQSLRNLRQSQLTRVSLGVESGDPLVRDLYGKSWKNDDLRAQVADLKSAGIHLSVLVLVGAGGKRYAVSHVERTGELLNSLGLTKGDTVFLLDAEEVQGDPTQEDPHGRLIMEEQIAQQERLKQGLEGLSKRSVKVAPYTLFKQWR